MASKKFRDYECGVIHERVQIYLRDRRKLGLQAQKEYFVQCNQEECQYVEHNKLPCPLSVSMFSEEIEEREEWARKRKEEHGTTDAGRMR